MDKICELLTFEKITFVCPICGRKKTVASPFIPDLYMICECGYKISTKEVCRATGKRDIKMNKKEVLDAISQEFQKSLQDIGATNGDVIKAVFPNVIFEIEDDCPHVVDIALGGLVQSFHKDWLNAPCTESEAAE